MNAFLNKAWETLKKWMAVFWLILKWTGIGIAVLIISAFVLLAIDEYLPEGWKLTSEVFVVLSSVALSVTWTFFPKLRVKFAALESSVKSVVNLILMVLLGVLMFVFTCTNWNPIPGVECTVQGAKALGVLIFLAVAGNQLTYTMSTAPADVKEAKEAREAVG